MFIPILISIIVIALCLGVVWVLKNLGLFEPISIRIVQPPFNQLTILYKFQQSDYSKTGHIFKDIGQYSSSHDKLGIYYDNPKTTPAGQRRFAVGVIVDEIKDRDLIERMKNNDYKIFKLPQLDRSVYTTFPFKNILSVFIAIMRVPGRLGDFIREKKLEAHPFIEIYKRPFIHFVVPLSDFAAYYVPEISNK